ncbi:MAG: hypothetical protein ACRCZB_07650 [Bacteroidales bacterium]
MKSFKDLEFKEHCLAAEIGFEGSKHAIEQFENGYGVSVLFGSNFYSDGISTYEVAILFRGKITYSTDIAENGVIGYLSEEEVSGVMQKIQNINKSL